MKEITDFIKANKAKIIAGLIVIGVIAGLIFK